MYAQRWVLATRMFICLADDISTMKLYPNLVFIFECSLSLPTVYEADRRKRKQQKTVVVKLFGVHFVQLTK